MTDQRSAVAHRSSTRGRALQRQQSPTAPRESGFPDESAYVLPPEPEGLDVGEEIAQDSNTRRMIQNRIAQRKFRDKVRQQRVNAEIQRGAAGSYSTPEPEDLDTGEEGLPWGSISLRHVVSSGRNKEQSSRETSIYATASKAGGSSRLGLHLVDEYARGSPAWTAWRSRFAPLIRSMPSQGMQRSWSLDQLASSLSGLVFGQSSSVQADSEVAENQTAGDSSSDALASPSDNKDASSSIALGQNSDADFRPPSPDYDSCEPILPDFAFDTDEVDVDFAAVMDPSIYEAELDDLETLVLEQYRNTRLFPLELSEDLQSDSPPAGSIEAPLLTPRDDFEMGDYFKELQSALDSMQERGFCTEHITLLVQDPRRKDVVQCKDISIYDIHALCSLRSSTGPSSTTLNALIGRLERVFQIDPMNKGTLSHPSHSPEDSIPILCSLLRLAIALYLKSHCAGLPWPDFGAVRVIRYQGPTGTTHRIACRHLACLHEFIGDEVWVFDAADSHEHASVSISVRQLAELWGPIYAVPSSKGLEHPIALLTEGGLLYRSNSETVATTLAGSDVPCHWARATPTRSAPGSLEDNSTTSTHSFSSPEEFPNPIESFPLTSRLLIGYPDLTGVTPVSFAGATGDLVTTSQCCLDLETFWRQNAFNIQPSGSHEAHFTPEEHHISLSAGQYINVGLQKTWKRRPAVTHKDRLLSFCCGSLATPERLKQILQLRIGLEVSACTFSASRTTLEELLKIAFPNDLQQIEKACAVGDASVVAAYLGELKPTGLSRDETGLFHWPLSIGISEVYQAKNLPTWIGLLKDTPQSCCFATLSARCLQFAIHDRGQLLGSVCASGLKDKSSPALRTCIEINPASGLRPPLKQNRVVPLTFGALRIRKVRESLHAALFCAKKAIWPVGWSRGGMSDDIHRELQVASRASQHTFEVWIIDAK